MTDATEARPAVDFARCGMPLAEWLGQLPHETVLKAAAEAVRIPDEPIIVGIVYMDEVFHAAKWATHERAAIRRWFISEHPDKPGRMRVGTRTVLEPGTGQDVKVVFVEYEPTYKVKKKAG